MNGGVILYDIEEVKNILESSINNLMHDFIEQPYKHRCEHSLHCELYNMLMKYHALQGIFQLKDTDFGTTLLHKEWPETIPRPEKSNRRGNFDIAILNPKSVSRCNIKEFNGGRIKPDFVVEIGLNYGLEHLESDEKKLINSDCKGGYLVHLWQPHKGIKKDQLTALTRWLQSAKNNIGIGVVLFNKGKLEIEKYL